MKKLFIVLGIITFNPVYFKKYVFGTKIGRCIYVVIMTLLILFLITLFFI